MDFEAQHSCQDAITELTSSITKNWENSKSSIAVFIDLSKAFDTLQHEVLFNKLEKYGIRGNALKWFQSYLSDRTMSAKCKIKGDDTCTISEKFGVNIGSPQGSCLGPLLFLIFNNDLHHVLTWSRCILFADDTTIYFSHNNVDFLKWCLSEDLKALSDWFRANKLTLNLQKTVCVHFTDKQLDAGGGILLGDVEISFTNNTKFLGVWLDKNLSWKGHTSKLMIKLKRNLSLLREAKKFLEYTDLKNSLLRSNL